MMMRNLKKKVLSLMLAVMILATGILAASATIYAAGEGQKIDVSAGGSGELAVFDDMTKVTGTWDGNKPHEFDGKKLKITPDVSGNINGLMVTNVKPGVYKVGYFLTIQDIINADNPPTADELPGIQDYRFRTNPTGNTIEGNVNFGNMYGNNPYFPCEFAGVVYEGLSTVVGKKIMIVTVIKVPEAVDKIELRSWPRSGYLTATLDKIVFASADHNFNSKNYPGYILFKEAVPEEGDDRYKPADNEWTPSKEEGPGTADPGGEDNKPTGDMTINVFIVLAAMSLVGFLAWGRRKATT